ncbi:MAG: hypothetical protein BGO12_16760 [Verrucomicrobia bacterium 61-8]|nr:MAG: hypothetical protein BGO12_16760 [Verrucomicrobia bacterium 61-8]
MFAASFFTVIAWGYSVFTKPRLSEESLRTVTGVEIRVAETQSSPRGLFVSCVAKNQTQKVASSLIFTVEITTESGHVLATNPLGNMLGLKPGESRAIQVPMPSNSELSPPFLTRARVDLVRWEQ